MALATTTLFTRLGRLFKHAEAVRDFQAALNTQHTSTVGQYSGAALEYIGNVSRHLESRKVAAQQTSNDLLDAAIRTLIETADANFTLVTKDTEGAIREVIKQMVGDSDSVNANTITIGSASAGGSNVGNGTFLVSAVAPIVDRYGNRPGNLQLQNVKTETITARCTDDSTQRGIDEQNERFLVFGQRAVNRFDEDWPAGSGKRVVVNAVSSKTDGGRRPTQNVTTNGDMEDFTSNKPDHWTLESGTAGNHVFAAGSGFNGSNALKLVGDGSTTIRLYQRLRLTSETLGQINPDRPYSISFAVKYATAAPSASIRVSVEDASGNRLNSGIATREMSETVTSGSVTTSYVVHTNTCFSPTNIPKGSRIVVETTAALANTSQVFIDDICVAEMRRLGPGSPAVQLIPGSTAFRLGDEITRTVSNNLDGVMAKEFDRFFDMEGRGLALPANTGGSETVPDSRYA
mgnify:CR=1 FL=1